MWGRMVLVGFGAVFATSVVVDLAMVVADRDLLELRYLVFPSLILPTGLSILLLVPMLAIWVAIFAALQNSGRRIRQAASIASLISAAIGMLVVVMCLGVIGGDPVELLWVLLPIFPVAMGIATGLTWYAFDSV